MAPFDAGFGSLPLCLTSRSGKPPHGPIIRRSPAWAHWRMVVEGWWRHPSRGPRKWAESIRWGASWRKMEAKESARCWKRNSSRCQRERSWRIRWDLVVVHWVDRKTWRGIMIQTIEDGIGEPSSSRHHFMGSKIRTESGRPSRWSSNTWRQGFSLNSVGSPRTLQRVLPFCYTKLVILIIASERRYEYPLKALVFVGYSAYLG